MIQNGLELEPDLRETDLLRHERPLWRRRLCVAGIDEAGRGCLAGPVVAAAVVLPANAELPGVIDSKLLTDRERRALLPAILHAALGVGIGVRSARRIDRTNVLIETKQAMLAAVARLPLTPDFLLIDGNQRLPTAIQQRTVIKGDRLSLSIAAASIVAKVTRDDIMLRLHRRFGAYHWDENKGYGTPDHLSALRRHGPCCLHRFTFHGVGDGKP